MLDNYLLQELVTFAETGTLAAAAEQLHVTQPTLTRGMQKLEAELGVTLFDRQPNRIQLTPTGQFAAKQAAQLIVANQQLTNQVRNFALTQQALTVGASLPGPLQLVQHLAIADHTLKIWPQLLTTDQLTTALKQHKVSLLLSNQALTDHTITAEPIGTEDLSVNLSKFMYQANQVAVNFSELNDLSFIVLHEIGPWRAIVQQAIPTAKFFYQEQPEALSEIIQNSDFPYFTTNLSRFSTETLPADERRICLPISDASTHQPIYANYLTTASTRVRPLIKRLRQTWPKS
ncbi:hypothetical protein [Lactobacillus allii] [Lactiplantibacillus mudanjiangensis]|uniref:LysR family transcriptional regulator n=1 Tax=Lactiplantibacillus mudanjiangensis TaxID=1296538 RepID=UPI0010143F17|nr:LysR family transcriptional regulator [Lactiplantibacillus mudanjiangensis]VDG30954.1 hypothetical protein [Lactobacillus allii] [Lactiplantibacillus mudanjiangensis]